MTQRHMQSLTPFTCAQDPPITAQLRFVVELTASFVGCMMLRGYRYLRCGITGRYVAIPPWG